MWSREVKDMYELEQIDTQIKYATTEEELKAVKSYIYKTVEDLQLYLKKLGNIKIPETETTIIEEKIENPYTLPVAGADVLGGVKVGEGLEMDGDVLKLISNNLRFEKAWEFSGGTTIYTTLNTDIPADKYDALLIIGETYTQWVEWNRGNNVGFTLVIPMSKTTVSAGDYTDYVPYVLKLQVGKPFGYVAFGQGRKVETKIENGELVVETTPTDAPRPVRVYGIYY